MGHKLSSSTDTDELLALISAAIPEVCESETSSIILMDDDRKDMYFKETTGKMGEIIKRIRIPLNENSIAGYCIMHKTPVLVNDTSKDPRHYKKTDQVSGFSTRSILACPIIWGDKVFGCLEAVNKLENGFNEKDQEYLNILAHQAAVALKNVYLMERLQNFFSYSVEILIAAIETLEPYAQGHTIKVARLSTAIARKMGLSGKELEEIWYAAYFHDVGKLTRESIYMSRQEIEKMHTIMGAGLVEKIKLLENCAPFIRHHHERWDGSGFPDGLKGDAIPMGAQIIGISEDYVEKRSGAEEQNNLEDFNARYLEYAGMKFNPDLVGILREVLESIKL
jgi:putative nucleotidyltransferase with HDIG domain